MFDADFFSRPAHLINRAARLMARLGDELLAPYGFSVGQLPVLGMLSEGEALPQKLLAQGAKIEQPSMAQMLNRMERDGLIHRAPDPADKRSSLISLTETARNQLPAVLDDMKRGGNDALAGLTPDEIATLTRLLRTVIANLESMSVDQ